MTEKSVLDACCGARMFWFDKQNPDVVYMDKRRETHLLKDKSVRGGTRTLIIDPDIMGDFTSIPFPDEHFAVVVFDPPHLVVAGETGWQAKKYGRLNKEWRAELRQGFSECFRVLKSEGTLIFKWCALQIPVSEILSLTDHQPLMGQRSGKAARTHWIVFLKGSQRPSEQQPNIQEPTNAR